MTRVRWRWRAATRRAASSAPSAMCATTSSRPAFLPISTTSMSRPRFGATAWRRIGAAPDKTPFREAFAPEAPRLLALPDNPYPLIERVAVKAGKTPYVRFDLNDYSIPHTKVQRLLTVLADPNEVRIVDGAQVLVCHRRSYDKGAQIEDATHVQALVQHKRAARH